MLYLFAVIVVVLDQVIEWMIVANLGVNQVIPLIPGVLDLFYIKNYGAAFSMLIDQRVLLIFVSIAVMLVIVYVDRRYAVGKMDMKVALGVLFGGAAGNLIDRVHLGYVVDYIYLPFIHFPVFNLADSAIVVSMAYLLLRFFIRSELKDQKRGGKEDVDERT